MPRKNRDVAAGLVNKGFERNEQSHHVFFAYRLLDGRLSTKRTKLSHAAPGHDVSDNLLGQMARQVGLSRPDFLQLIDCPLTRHDYERKVEDA